MQLCVTVNSDTKQISRKMASATTTLTPLCQYTSSSLSKTKLSPIPIFSFSVKPSNNPQISLCTTNNRLIAFHSHVSLQPLKAASSSTVVSSEYGEEPETKVKFQTLLDLPGSTSSLCLLGTGYREKVFAIIGVKVYAAALYANKSIFSGLDAWKGQPAANLLKDSSLFEAIFQASLEKSLHIVLVRDVDGKTFWDALDDAISPRIKSPTLVDKAALSTFRSTFEGRSLKKGTSIFMSWVDTAKMLVSVSSDGIPAAIDATIESPSVTSALFDVFLGSNPVSPTLKASVSNSLAAFLR